MNISFDDWQDDIYVRRKTKISEEGVHLYVGGNVLAYNSTCAVQMY